MNILRSFCASKSHLGTKSVAKPQRRFRPSLLALEDRLAPAVITVTTDLDLAPANDKQVTLREAITAANMNAAFFDAVGVGAYGADTINFNIPGGGVRTIFVLSPLPALTAAGGACTIAGNTQPGFVGLPLVELNGSKAGSANGLVVQAANCTVRSLIINNFNGAGIVGLQSKLNVGGCFIGTTSDGSAAAGNTFGGIVISGPATASQIGGKGMARNVISGNGLSGVAFHGPGAVGNFVQANYIGTDAGGTVDLGNGGDGVLITEGADKNIVGGTSSRERNVISGNNKNGVRIAGFGTTFNLVHGNFIGTDFQGTLPLGNTFNGVEIDHRAQSNTVGGTVFIQNPTSPLIASRNVISANGLNGVSISGLGTETNLVLGNLIGTDVSGMADLGNVMNGVRVSEMARKNIIGGSVAFSGNVISGNNADGVQITGFGTNINLVLGNYIGVNVAGMGALGNSYEGVGIYDNAASNLVGGLVSKPGTIPGNLISANGGDGVLFLGAGTTGNRLLGNFIGTDKTGAAALGNAFDGVRITSGANFNSVGGAGIVAGNVISGNKENGVEIEGGGTSFNVVQGNFIGTTVTGNAPLKNSLSGVYIHDAASDNLVGGLKKPLGNLISGNTYGVNITIGANGNMVQGNFIGTNLLGTGALPNDTGVLIANFSANNIVGGTAAGAGNVISGNITGVAITDRAVSNRVEANFIGTKASGVGALGNTFAGVLVSSGANGNFVGGTSKGAGNVIAGNTNLGVLIFGTGTEYNQVLANFIGLDNKGASLGNGSDGVFVASAAAHNSIGGVAFGAGNRIAANGGHGVHVGSNASFTTAGSFNSILSNSIYGNLGQGIELANDGITANDSNDPDAGPNDLLNKPNLYFAFASPSGATTSLFVIASLNTAPNLTGLRLEFFDNPTGGPQGQVFLGAFDGLSTDGFGTHLFIGTVIVPSASVAGHTLTATLTDALGNTSEYSLPLTL